MGSEDEQTVDNPEQDCPICNSSQSAKESFAAAKVAEHMKEKARYDDEHHNWIDENTNDGTLSEIRESLDRINTTG